VLNRLVASIYARMRQRYMAVFVLAELVTSVAVAAIAVPLMLRFYHHSTTQGLELLGLVCAAVLVGVGYALWAGKSHLDPLFAWWDSSEPTPEQAVSAWDAATNWAMRSFRANSVYVAAIAGIPTVVFVALVLHLGAGATPVLFAATLIPIAYGTAVNYAIAELMIRPVTEEIALTLPEDFPFNANGLLLQKRLKLLLPIFTSFVGFFVAALMIRQGGGTKILAESVGAAVGVGFVFSFELTVLLGRSVTGPIKELRQGVSNIRAGDYSARVRVLTSDELGELSHDFNQMAVDLAERERIREAFGTYLDNDIVPLILSGRYPQEGVTVEISIMFVDVRGFTSFAEQAEATEVIAALNSLFEVIVPIVRDHGGHVDKFLGDGLLAVFGAPEGYEDHADRAVEAGLDIVHAVNTFDATLEVGVGVNTGPVVAGSVGGGGRLNFSVIGDAVNVAARVEEATRSTGDGMLIAADTRNALQRHQEVISRGSIELKGKSEPMEVFACEAATQVSASTLQRAGDVLDRLRTQLRARP
jgi:adenylate cyclase